MMIDPYSAVKISCLVGIICVLVGLPFALFFGWILARKNFLGKSFLSLIILFPLSLPPVVTGLLLLYLVGRDTTVGYFFSSIGLPLTFSLSGAVLASVVVGFPLYVMMIRSAFETVDKKYEEIALTLGLSRWQVFFKITLPLAFPGILAGMIIAFARAMGEFGATSIIAGNIEGETRTISLALYSLLDAPEGVTSGQTLIIISLLMSFVSIAGYEWLIRWHRKKLELIDE
jgi:molybdate transport system permease protein